MENNSDLVARCHAQHITHTYTQRHIDRKSLTGNALKIIWQMGSFQYWLPAKPFLYGYCVIFIHNTMMFATFFSLNIEMRANLWLKTVNASPRTDQIMKSGKIKRKKKNENEIVLTGTNIECNYVTWDTAFPVFAHTHKLIIIDIWMEKKHTRALIILFNLQSDIRSKSLTHRKMTDWMNGWISEKARGEYSIYIYSQDKRVYANENTHCVKRSTNA